MKYDFIVIGGGSAGLVASKFAKGVGKKVAIVERHKLGGDCTHFGCIPSKALLNASHLAQDIRNIKNFGLEMDTSSFNADGAFAHVRKIVSDVYATETPDIFEEEGIDIIEGQAEFIDNMTISVDGKEYSADKFLIATGSSPFIPPIKGLEDVNYLTNETIFHLDKLPKSIAVLGGGPIGIELATAFNGLGVDVAVIEMNDRILPKEDEELSELLKIKLEADGLNILTETKVLSAEQFNDYVSLKTAGKLDEVKAEKVLVATGRKPNLEGMRLTNAGVKFDKQGVRVDKYLKTNAPNIYAAGDVVPPYQFTHVADYEAVTACRNAFLPLNKAVDYSNVGWCTYTEPELARVGMTEKEARAEYGDNIRVFRYEFAHVDRGISDGKTDGLAKYVTDKKGRILGAHILGSRAGEVIHEAMLAKANNIPFQKISNMVHIYPTYSYAVRQPSKYAVVEMLLDNPFIKFIRGLKK